MSCRIDAIFVLLLIRTKRFHGFDAGGAASGNPTGNQGCAEQHKRYDGDSSVVERTDAIEHTLHFTADEVRADEANAKAYKSKNKGLFEDEADDVAATCSEGHAQADFVLALSDGEGHHAIDTDCRKGK